MEEVYQHVNMWEQGVMGFPIFALAFFKHKIWFGQAVEALHS